MTLIVDATPLVAMADAKDPQAEAVFRVLSEEQGELVLPATISAEVDYLLGERFGSDARRAFLADLAAGRYEVPALIPEEYAEVVSLEARYADQKLGLADCSAIILARRYSTRRILTFDERHFRALAPLQGGAFEVLPADA